MNFTVKVFNQEVVFSQYKLRHAIIITRKVQKILQTFPANAISKESILARANTSS